MMATAHQSTQSLPPSVQCSPIFVEYQLMKEFVLFQKQNLNHVYLVPSYSSAFDWFGVLFIHSGLYAGMILRFTIHISASYPNCDVPKIIFDPVPIHPFVNKDTGELDTSHRFTKWNSTNNFIFEIVTFAKEVFEVEELAQLQQFYSNSSSNGGSGNNNLIQVSAEESSSSEQQSMKTLIEETKEKFNEAVVKRSGEDRHYISFAEPTMDNAGAVIEKLRAKLIADQVNIEAMVDPMGRNAHSTGNGGGGAGSSYTGGTHYSSPSISGLSWTKKIVYK